MKRLGIGLAAGRDLLGGLTFGNDYYLVKLFTPKE